MAGSKALQFFLLISLMIFSTHALKVLLTDGLGRFEYETVIDYRVNTFGKKIYKRALENNTFEAGPYTTQVIVYIGGHSKIEKIARKLMYASERWNISRELHYHRSELLYLGVVGFDHGDNYLVGEFLIHAIEFHSDQTHSKIVTIGAPGFYHTYKTSLGDLEQYMEDRDIFFGKLQKEIEKIPA